jgi:hypothetical protein
MKILVCGSRKFDNWVLMRETLKEFLGPKDILIHGSAVGADRMSEDVAYHLYEHPTVERYPADWEKHGKAAGPIRNKQMLDEGKPDLVIAFLAPNSRGTKNMIEQAQKAGVPVKIVELNNENKSK